MKVTIEVDIPVDESEPEFCSNDCPFNLLADSANCMGNDHCWLFRKALTSENGFSLRCMECITATQKGVNK